MSLPPAVAGTPTVTETPVGHTAAHGHEEGQRVAESAVVSVRYTKATQKKRATLTQEPPVMYPFECREVTHGNR